VNRPFSIPSRRTTATVAVVLAAVLLAVVALARAGQSSAVWTSETHTLQGGVKHAPMRFAAKQSYGGSDAIRVKPGERQVEVPITRNHAKTLLERGYVAVSFSVETKSEGNLGMRYTATLPDFEPGTVFGSARVRLVKTTGPQLCVRGVEGEQTTTSTPHPATYTDADRYRTEYWCLSAELDPLPDEGTHAGTATVTGESAAGEVTDSDTWKAEVTTGLRAEDEPELPVSFSFEQFRPDGTVVDR